MAAWSIYSRFQANYKPFALTATPIHMKCTCTLSFWKKILHHSLIGVMAHFWTNTEWPGIATYENMENERLKQLDDYYTRNMSVTKTNSEWDTTD